MDTLRHRMRIDVVEEASIHHFEIDSALPTFSEPPLLHPSSEAHGDPTGGMRLNDAKKRANKLMDSNPEFYLKSTRIWANEIACSVGLVPRLQAWVDAMSKRGQPRLKKACKTPRAESLADGRSDVDPIAVDPAKLVEADDAINPPLQDATSSERQYLNQLETTQDKITFASLSEPEQRELLASYEPSEIDPDPPGSRRTIRLESFFQSVQNGLLNE